MSCWACHLFHFFGCRAATPQRVHSAKDLDEASTVLATVGPGVDICELSGGEARTTTVAVRRHLQAGRNLDLVTQADLGDPEVQQTAMRYLLGNEVQVLLMAPSCRTFGSPPQRSINRSTTTTGAGTTKKTRHESDSVARQPYTRQRREDTSWW